MRYTSSFIKHKQFEFAGKCSKWEFFRKKSISFNIITIISDSLFLIWTWSQRYVFNIQFISFLPYNYVRGDGERE